MFRYYELIKKFQKDNSWHLYDDNSILFCYPINSNESLSEITIDVNDINGDKMKSRIINVDIYDLLGNESYLRNFNENDINNFKLLNLHPKFYLSCIYDGVKNNDCNNLEIFNNIKVKDINLNTLLYNDRYYIEIVCILEYGYEDPNEIYNKLLNTRILDLPQIDF